MCPDKRVQISAFSTVIATDLGARQWLDTTLPSTTSCFLCVYIPVAEAAGLTITPEASVPLLKLSDLGCVMELTLN